MAVQLILQRAGGGTINLYNKNAASLSTVIRAEQKISLLGEDVVNVTVESAVKIPFSIGDKTTVFGREYKINRLPKPKKTGNRLLTYDIELEGVQYDLARATYDLNIDTTNNELQDVQADTLTGNLHRFVTVLLSNANRVFPGKWVLGEYPADTEDKTLTFGEMDNCLSVLQRLCSEYNTEFDIEQVGGVNTINFGKAGQIFPYTFEYGKGKGLYELERQNVSSANIVTRLKVLGGTRNVSYKYRANRLCLPGKTKGQSYIEKPDAVNKYGIWEATKYFDNIYPSRTGTITGLVSGSVLKFVDNTMNFDLNEKEADGVTTKYLLDGVAAKIHFNSGNLSGYEFELQSYDHATKTFTLKPFKDERDETFPSEKSEAFQFAAGDKYVILDIALPQSYIDTAEARLATEGDTYYDQNSQPKVQYSLNVAEEFLKGLSGSGSTTNIFQVGDYLPIKDTDIDVDKSVRIQGFTRNLIDEYKYQLTISDTVTTNITNRVISELIDIDKVIKINNLKDPAKARRDWRSAQELLDMIFDTEGDYYSEKIKPGSIETQMLSVGAKSTQFGLVGTVIQANYNGNKNSVNVKGGVLTHYTIEEDGRIWNLADNTTTLTGDSTPYYIYAKCQRVGTAGSIIFSTSQIKVDQDPDFYHLFVGVVNSVDPTLNVRSVALTYGFTTINGRFVRTGRIQSNDGSTYFDLDLGEIGGKITFASGGSQTDLSDWANDITGDIQDTQQAANDAEAKAQQAIDAAAANVTDYNAKFAQVQQQIDGEISNWFYAYSPTLSNYPASDWTTTTEKDRHIGDTFTNTQPSPAPDAGKSWRFVKNGSVYSWTLIADSDAVKALQQAALAQATADGKSTTFLVQPTSYHLGDTWVLNADRTVNGTAYKQGEILTATQDSVTFVEAHWVKRVRYTDDTAVDNLQIGSRNFLLNTATPITKNGTSAWSIWSRNLNSLIAEGSQVTLQFDIESGTSYNLRIYKAKTPVISWDSNLSELSSQNTIIGKRTISVTFDYTDISTYPFIGIYKNSSASTSDKVTNMCLVPGNKGTWSEAPEDIQARIDNAKQEALAAAGNAQTSANIAQTTANDLKNFTDTAFADGIADRGEKAAIEKYLNTLNESMSKSEASYNKIYTNTYLEGTAKTALLNAKINLWGQRDVLLSAINTAISGGFTTPAQKIAVDNAFNSFNSLMQAFQNSLEEANKSIHVKLDNIAKGYVNNLQIGGRNLIRNSKLDNRSSANVNGCTLTPVSDKFGLVTEIERTSGSGGFQIQFTRDIPLGTKITLSIKYKNISGGEFMVGDSNNGGSANYSMLSNSIYDGMIDLGSDWYLLWRTITYNGTGTFGINSCKGKFRVCQIQAEIGNKPTDWAASQEDIQTRIDNAATIAADALAKANTSKAITDKFGTTIDGGLVSAVMLVLRALDSQTVTAGISGIQGANRDNPVFWAGGTYDKAFALIQFLSKMSAGTTPGANEYADLAKITMLHNGAAKVGDFIIEESGRIVMVDPSTGKPRLIFGVFNIPTVADLLSETQFGDSVNTGGGTVTMTTPQMTLSGSVTVDQDNSTLTFGGTLMTITAFRGPGAGSAGVALRVYRNGIFYATIAGVSVSVIGGESGYEEINTGVKVLTGVPTGTYTLRAELTWTGDIIGASGTVGTSTLAWLFSKNVEYFQFSLDGMMSWWQNFHVHMSKDGGLDGRALPDKWNAPGVLLSASVQTNGGFLNSWGAKKHASSTAVRNSTGRYTVYHSVGHTNYQVTASSATANRSYHIVSRDVSSFIIEWRTIGSSPALSDTAFDFQITGNNYN